MDILYIEDNYDDVIMISDMLSKDNGIDFNLKSASNLNEGIEELLKAPFDVILLDLGLPDSFGLDAVNRIADLKKNIPIIVLTGTSDKDLGIKAVKMGAQDYLIKEQVDEYLIAKTIQYADVRNKLNKKEIESRQKVENQLDELSNRLLLATKGANIGIWEYVIPSGKLIWDDRMFALYELTPEEFSGNYEVWESRLHPKDKSNAIKELELALNDEKEFNTEFRIVLPDESICYIKATGFVKRDRKGNPLKMVGTNWDITKEKMAELLVIQAEKDKRKHAEHFAYIASHDLQEPLRTIQSFTNFFIEDYEHLVDKKGIYFLETINDSSKRMSDLITGLLSYSEIGKSGPLTTINSNQILEEIRKDLTTILKERKAVIEIKGLLPSLKGYELELRQLFLNLITNGTKFVKEGVIPTIQINAKEYKKHWQFSIKDNGIGIEAKNLEKIFEIFKRLHNKEKFKGTGIGLAHCKKIVEHHDGKIWVESVVNEGSTFHFTISKTIKKNLNNNEQEVQLLNVH